LLKFNVITVCFVHQYHVKKNNNNNNNNNKSNYCCNDIALFLSHRAIWLLPRAELATCQSHRVCWTNRDRWILGSSASRSARCRKRISGQRIGHHRSSGPWARCFDHWATACALPNRLWPLAYWGSAQTQRLRIMSHYKIDSARVNKCIHIQL